MQLSIETSHAHTQTTSRVSIEVFIETWRIDIDAWLIG
jgi:hypothetical protein